MDLAAEVAQRGNYTLDQDMLKVLVKTSVANHRIATYVEIERAFEILASEERRKAA